VSVGLHQALLHLLLELLLQYIIFIFNSLFKFIVSRLGLLSVDYNSSK